MRICRKHGSLGEADNGVGGRAWTVPSSRGAGEVRSFSNGGHDVELEVEELQRMRKLQRARCPCNDWPCRPACRGGQRRAMPCGSLLAQSPHNLPLCMRTTISTVTALHSFLVSYIYIYIYIYIYEIAS